MTRHHIINGWKVCTKCAKNKRVGEFYKQAGGRWITGMCRRCYNDYMMARQKEARSIPILLKGEE